jgi:hypothetical protein
VIERVLAQLRQRFFDGRVQRLYAAARSHGSRDVKDPDEMQWTALNGTTEPVRHCPSRRRLRVHDRGHLLNLTTE